MSIEYENPLNKIKNPTAFELINEKEESITSEDFLN